MAGAVCEVHGHAGLVSQHHYCRFDSVGPISSRMEIFISPVASMMDTTRPASSESIFGQSHRTGRTHYQSSDATAPVALSNSNSPSASVTFRRQMAVELTRLTWPTMVLSDKCQLVVCRQQDGVGLLTQWKCTRTTRPLIPFSVSAFNRLFAGQPSLCVRTMKADNARLLSRALDYLPDQCPVQI